MLLELYPSITSLPIDLQNLVQHLQNGSVENPKVGLKDILKSSFFKPYIETHPDVLTNLISSDLRAELGFISHPEGSKNNIIFKKSK